MRVSSVVAALSASGHVLGNHPARAQEDTTAPALLEFTISPLAFDTGASAVALQWHATAADKLVGVDDTLVGVIWPNGQLLTGGAALAPSPQPLEFVDPGALDPDDDRCVPFDGWIQLAQNSPTLLLEG